jgi:pimeloyl-ACP methyl ester carboxylesterase
MKRRSTRKRLLIILLATVVTLVLVLYVGLPAGSALAAVMPQSSSDGSAPEGFRDLALTTEDGLTLAAWYAAPDNGAAVILVHGAGSGRGSMIDYARMLRDAGFGVLALNVRGFGDSEGPTNRLGWEATPDIAAAAGFLSEQPDVQAIGGLGLSMGGEILLGAAADSPRVQAIVTDGATYRSAAEYESLPSNSPWYRSFSQHIFNAFVRLFTGTTPPERTLLDSIRRAEETQFLFVAAGADDDEIAYNTLFQEAAPARSALWVIPGVGHTAGYAANPEAYQARVADFFTQAMLE